MSIKSEEKKIRELLVKNVFRTITKNDLLFCDLIKIMACQEKWEYKLDTIRSFKITRSRLNKAVILQVKVNNCSRWLTVSWRKGSVKKRKECNPLQSAFRQAIYRQISTWKKSNKIGSKCVKCENTKKLQADHKDPLFIQLTSDFLKRPINKNIPSVFDYHKCGRKFCKKDRLFKVRWQNYHRKHATIQWLCMKCNLSKKKS